MTGFRALTLSVAASTGLGLGLTGCNKGEDVRTFDDQDNVTNTDPGHAHAHGPHDGHVIELGGEDYHAELTLDGERRPTVYLLESDVKTPLAVDAASVSLRLQVEGEKQEFTLTPAPAEGEAEGKSSVFRLDEPLPASIKDAEDLEGEVVVTFGGTQYRGAITHDHDHGHDH